MELIRFRCPECRKLFSAQTQDLKGARPKFQCPQCQTKFWIEFPMPEGVEEARSQRMNEKPPEAAKVELPQVEASQKESEPSVGAGASAESQESAEPPIRKFPPSMSLSGVTGSKTAGTSTSHLDIDTVGKKISGLQKFCPRCQASIAAEMKECPKCGIIFDRLKGREFRPDPVLSAISPEISEEAVPKALKELWSEVLGQWDNRVLHDRFFQESVALSQIPYASRVYKKYLDKNPHDPTAKLMRDRIVSVSVFTMIPERQNEKTRSRFGFTGLILILGLAFLLTGFVVPGMRSLVAMGAAIIALGLGMKYFVKF